MRESLRIRRMTTAALGAAALIAGAVVGCVNGETDDGAPSPASGGQSSGGAANVAGTLSAAPAAGTPATGSPQAGTSSGAGRGGSGTSVNGASAGSTTTGSGGTSSGSPSGSAGRVGSSAGRAGGSGGAPGSTGGTSSRGGASNGGASSGGTPSGQAGSTGAAGGPIASGSGFGSAMHGGQGSSSDRYYKAAVTRNGKNYYFMANGWGPGFQSQSVTFNGTSFTVASMQGQQGGGYEPASYPTVFCGVYSDSRSGECGLPKAISEIQSLRTGWRWKPNGNTGQYNVAYDVWLGNNTSVQGHSSFLMVWLRDPPGQQPAGMRRHTAITVANVPGTWDLWAGTVGGKPCISYVKAEGQDLLELEFDVMDFVRDVPMRQIQLPGSHVLSVAVGFEIWNGPVNNLVSEDFYVDVR